MSKSNVLQRLNDELSGLTIAVRQSLVQISDGARSVGAGTIWHAEGLIVTNAHVASHDGLQVILCDGASFPARLLARDRHLDLAVLMIETSGLPTIELGESRQLAPGQWVLALGHPWGQVGSASAGVVIGMSAEWQEFVNDGREWLVVNLQLRPGHSGGPIVDSAGRLVGINTMMNGSDVGIAVPVHVAKRFLHQALTI